MIHQNPELWHAISALGGAWGGPGSAAQQLGGVGMQQSQAWALQQELDRQRDEERRARRQQMLGSIASPLLAAAGGPLGSAAAGALGAGAAGTAAGTIAGQAVGGGIGSSLGAMSGGPMGTQDAFMQGALQYGGQGAMQQAGQMLGGGQPQMQRQQGGAGQMQPYGQVTGPQGTVTGQAPTIMPPPQQAQQAQQPRQQQGQGGEQQDLGMQVRDAVMQAIPQALAGAGMGGMAGTQQPMGGVPAQPAGPFGPQQATVAGKISPIMSPEQQQLVLHAPEQRAQARQQAQLAEREMAQRQQQAQQEAQHRDRQQTLKELEAQHGMQMDEGRFALSYAEAQRKAIESQQPELVEVPITAQDGHIISGQMWVYPDGQMSLVEGTDPIPSRAIDETQRERLQREVIGRQTQPPSKTALDKARIQGIQAQTARALSPDISPDSIPKGLSASERGLMTEVRNKHFGGMPETITEGMVAGMDPMDFLRSRTTAMQGARDELTRNIQEGTLSPHAPVPPEVIFADYRVVDSNTGEVITEPGIVTVERDEQGRRSLGEQVQMLPTEQLPSSVTDKIETRYYNPQTGEWGPREGGADASGRSGPGLVEGAYNWVTGR